MFYHGFIVGLHLLIYPYHALHMCRVRKHSLSTNNKVTSFRVHIVLTLYAHLSDYVIRQPVEFNLISSDSVELQKISWFTHKFANSLKWANKFALSSFFDCS